MNRNFMKTTRLAATAGIVSLVFGASLFAGTTAYAGTFGGFLNAGQDVAANTPATAPEPDNVPDTPASAVLSLGTPEPLAAPETEATPVDVVAVDQMCRSSLVFGGSDASVLDDDTLQVYVKDGEVWVIQSGNAGVAKPEPPKEGEAVTEPAPIDLTGLGVSDITAVRACALAELLDGAKVVDGEAKMTPGEDDATVLPAEAVAVKSLTWVVTDAQGKPTAAFGWKFEVPANDGADASEPLPTPEGKDEPADLPDKGTVAWAYTMTTGRWTSSAIWTAPLDPAGQPLERVAGEVLYLNDGTPICDMVWVVDQAAVTEDQWVEDQAGWNEDVWKVDQAAWDEEVWVETGGHYEGADSWYCPTCDVYFTSQADCDDHYGNMLGLYYGYIGPSGDPNYPYMCYSCGTEYFEIYEVASEHIYEHAAEHYCFQVGWATWVVDGYYNTVHHDEVGHWEQVWHEEQGHWTKVVVQAEQGHWDYPEGISPKK